MISCYERSLFEQQTPYLQWLKERDCLRKSKVNKEYRKGKPVVKLPFYSCEESVSDCLKRAGISPKDEEIIIFYGANGFLDEAAEGLFAECFAKNKEVVLAYADEDYLGTLQEIYGDKVMESELAREYEYKNTGLYRGFPWFKPDYSPDTLRSFFYIGNIFAVRADSLAKLLKDWSKIGEDVQKHSIYEMVLALSEQVQSAGHISEILYTNEVKMQDIGVMNDKNSCYHRKNEIQIANDYTTEGKQTLCKLKSANSLISIIIPSKDNSKILQTCLSTLIEITDYPHYEIILVDNGSSEQERMCIKKYISEIEEDYDLKWADDDNPVPTLSIQYIYQQSDFNFSAMCNLGAKVARGEYLIFLNDDIEIMQPSWMQRMLEQASCVHVGAVGAKLYYPKDKQDTEKPYRIQHAGITNMGIGPAHKLAGMEDKGDLYHGHNLFPYNMLAVTAACLMVKKERFWQVGGFDETLAVAYNDVELCFKLYESGYYNVQRNDVTLLHHESISRGQDTSPEKAARLEKEKRLLYEKHPDLVARDPFYSEHLVQWKKDVAYSCNYLYPYDKEVDPSLLDVETAAKLPREHKNKYVRKLTGENLLMFQIDRAEVSEVEETLVIQGWFAMRQRDNAGIERYLLLKNIENDNVYRLAIYPQLRYDVEALFQSDTEQGRHATRNVALSGIQVIVKKNALTKGKYIIGILTDEKKRFYTKKICWKQDCVIEIF